jgi:hypothetical protein
LVPNFLRPKRGQGLSDTPPLWSTERMSSARRVLPAVALTALAIVVSACRSGQSESVCPPEQRQELLSQRRVDSTPTAPFTVERHTSAFVTVIFRDPADSGGLFGGIGPAATLHVLSGNAAPRLRTESNGLLRSDDPAVSVEDGRQWDALDLEPGTYHLYSLAGTPTIAVQSCPD